MNKIEEMMKVEKIEALITGLALQRDVTPAMNNLDDSERYGKMLGLRMAIEIIKDTIDTKQPASKLTVIFRDDAPMIHCGDSPSYRRVTLDLTEEQKEQIRINWTCTSMGQDIFESVSKCFFEE